ncbi:MAG TPA: ABC transporter permease [Trichormus sp.]|jgi:ABC-2 type transport system permease protein
MKDHPAEKNEPNIHLWPLVIKETREILRNKYLLFLLLVPPILQLLILGGALDPAVHHASIGVVDYDRGHESGELLSSMVETGIFNKRRLFSSEESLRRAIDNGKLDIALVIPQDFTRDVQLHRPAPVQVIVDGTNAYSGAIVSSYVLRTLSQWRPAGAVGATDQVTSAVTSMMVDSEAVQQEQAMIGTSQPPSAGSGSDTGGGAKNTAMGLLSAISGGTKSSAHHSSEQTPSDSSSQVAAVTPTEYASNLIKPLTLYLYNRGQVASWLFVPGVLGATLTLTATLVASAAILRERESGTIDQLLMTPAEPWEILMAKVLPIMFCLLLDVCVAISASRIVFGLPLRGSVMVLALGSFLYVLIGIGMGMLLGSVCQSQRQAQLTSFFINIPLILLSGTVVPRDSMPEVLKAASLIDPLRYYTDITRGVILKGNGLHILWQDLVLLFIFAVVMLSLSLLRFRRQTA